MAILFLVFDVELLFLYPWAVSAYSELGIPRELRDTVFGVMLVVYDNSCTGMGLRVAEGGISMAVGLPENVFLTSWMQRPVGLGPTVCGPCPFATACCGIELMATAASRHDLARFGAEVMRFSPRQCDLLIVAGRVVMKMLPSSAANLASDARAQMVYFHGGVCLFGRCF